MNKTIEIKKVHIISLFISVILGFSVLYGLEHLGTFSYKVDSPPQNSNEKPSLSREVPVTTKVLKIYFNSYFDNTIETNGNGFDLYDLNYSDTEFDKYSVRSYYYTKATIEDYKSLLSDKSNKKRSQKIDFFK